MTGGGNRLTGGTGRLNDGGLASSQEGEGILCGFAHLPHAPGEHWQTRFCSYTSSPFVSMLRLCPLAKGNQGNTSVGQLTCRRTPLAVCEGAAAVVTQLLSVCDLCCWRPYAASVSSLRQAVQATRRGWCAAALPCQLPAAADRALLQPLRRSSQGLLPATSAVLLHSVLRASA